MSTRSCGPAAHARALITGSKWTGPKRRVNIVLPRETLELARRYRICSILGRGGLLPVSQYLDDRIMEEVQSKRAAEKRLFEVGNNGV
jgi:hypothetical protein